MCMRVCVCVSGVASVGVLDNAVPYISGEEENMEMEPLKVCLCVCCVCCVRACGVCACAHYLQPSFEVR